MALRDIEIGNLPDSTSPTTFDYPTCVAGDLIVAHIGWSHSALIAGELPDTPDGWVLVETDDAIPEQALNVQTGTGGGGASYSVITFIKTADGTETGSETLTWPLGTPTGFECGTRICASYTNNPGLSWAIRQDKHDQVGFSSGITYNWDWPAFVNPAAGTMADVISLLLLKPCTTFWTGFVFNDATSHDGNIDNSADNQQATLHQGFVTTDIDFVAQQGVGTTQPFLSIAGWNAALMYPLEGVEPPPAPQNDWTPPKRRRKVSPQSMPHRLTSAWLQDAGEAHRA